MSLANKINPGVPETSGRCKAAAAAPKSAERSDAAVAGPAVAAAPAAGDVPAVGGGGAGSVGHPLGQAGSSVKVPGWPGLSDCLWCSPQRVKPLAQVGPAAEVADVHLYAGVWQGGSLSHFP